MALERIQKIIAAAGICSRREAEEMILEGRVKVNGRVAEVGEKADPDEDSIKIGNKLLRPGGGGKKLYLLLNKPKGYISSLKDPQKRRTVVDLLGNLGSRVYPVGRLDFDSEGLLLFTNDGDFANAVMHPSREVWKTYEVKVDGVLSDAQIDRLRNGVKLDEGMTAPALVKKKKLTEANSWVEICIHEGRYRQVRRMCEAVGHPVLKLKRTKIGPVELKGTPPGMYRDLTPGEVKNLLKAAGK